MPRTVATTRSVASTRTVASPRLVIRNNYTQSWALNGSTSYGTNAGIDYSAYNKLAFDFFIYRRLATGDSIVGELSTNYVSFTDSFGLISIAGPKIEFGWRDASGFCAWDSARIPTNEWVHVEGFMDRTVPSNQGCKVYIRGILSGAQILSTSAGGGTFGNRAFYMGSRAGASLFTNGLIKDLRICTFTGTYSTADAVSFYKNAVPSNFTVLNRWLGEDAGTTAVDSGSLGKNLTLSNVTYSPNVPCKLRTQAS